MEDFGGQKVKVHFVDNHSGTGESQLDADYALAKNLQAQERAYSLARFNSTSSDYEEFHGSSSSSFAFSGNYDLESTLQLKRDAALAQALSDAEDQEQLVIMLSLEDPHRVHQGERNTVQDDIDPDSMSYEERWALSDAMGSVNKGLTPEEISALRSKKYKPRCCFRSSEKECCTICYEVYERGVYMITLPCKHAYHAECVKKWLEINKNCPLCYGTVRPTKGKGS